MNARKQTVTLAYASGMDGIPVEVWKCLEGEGIDMLWDLMQGIYEQEIMPSELRYSVIIYL